PYAIQLPTPAEGTVETIAIPPLEVVRNTITVETTDARRTLGFIFGSVGLAGAVTAGITGVLALDDKATVEARCPERQCNGDPEGTDAANRGKTLLPINAIAWGVAALGIGAGTF